MTQEAKINSLQNVRSFITAGNALFTLRSVKTGERRTFVVEKAPPKEGMPEAFFVRSLRGPDNTHDYQYVGLLRERDDDQLTFKAKDNSESISAKAFSWLVAQVNYELTAKVQGEPRFYAQAEFWHAGRCGRCGRTLTTPESIASGIGPVCATRE